MNLTVTASEPSVTAVRVLLKPKMLAKSPFWGLPTVVLPALHPSALVKLTGADHRLLELAERYAEFCERPALPEHIQTHLSVFTLVTRKPTAAEFLFFEFVFGYAWIVHACIRTWRLKAQGGRRDSLARRALLADQRQLAGPAPTTPQGRIGLE
jgi:hypothetical protein